MTDYKRLRVLFPDHLGLARGKYLPAAHATTRVHHCIGTFALNFDRTTLNYLVKRRYVDRNDLGLPGRMGRAVG